MDGGGQQQLTPEQQQEQQQKLAQQEEQRDATLRAILDADARERLKRIGCVKPEKARTVENYVIQAVRQGRLPPPVSDAKLKQLLESIQEQSGGGAGPTITFKRKVAPGDD
eukprot:gene3277-5137_t